MVTFNNPKYLDLINFYDKLLIYILEKSDKNDERELWYLRIKES